MVMNKKQLTAEDYVILAMVLVILGIAIIGWLVSLV